jgi:hypothetical protein
LALRNAGRQLAIQCKAAGSYLGLLVVRRLASLSETSLEAAAAGSIDPGCNRSRMGASEHGERALEMVAELGEPIDGGERPGPAREVNARWPRLKIWTSKMPDWLRVSSEPNCALVPCRYVRDDSYSLAWTPSRAGVPVGRRSSTPRHVLRGRQQAWYAAHGNRIRTQRVVLRHSGSYSFCHQPRLLTSRYRGVAPEETCTCHS